MTKQAVKRMIKVAKKSAKDKAMEIAANLGKPTSTGVLTGAGLGTIMAALGALSRNGDYPGESSILSNPALLAAAGMAGGYLAGNAFHNAPTVRENKEMSNLALLGLLGGTGTISTLLSKLDARSRLAVEKNLFKAITRRGVAKVPTPEGGVELHPGFKRDIATGELKPVPFSDADLREYRNGLERYQKAVLRAEGPRKATLEAMYEPHAKWYGRLYERLKNSPYSPVSWGRSLNPFKDAIRRNSPSGAKLIGRQLAALFKNRHTRIPASIASALLLAGGGKAIYDYASD